QPLVLTKGERVAQGIFYKYLTTDDDKDTEKENRGGGFGSTGTVK
ncbi:MAG TPA: deoxyuridine 5'-triphosphate nucleotidohydrolase, partial [Acidaminococcaceae bacterium]|nr:deoxyuridine 5'-triphosphate nucleotidohydrolase [Acidaminococcaceae bacterium]